MRRSRKILSASYQSLSADHSGFPWRQNIAPLDTQNRQSRARDSSVVCAKFVEQSGQEILAKEWFACYKREFFTGREPAVRSSFEELMDKVRERLLAEQREQRQIVVPENS